MEILFYMLSLIFLGRELKAYRNPKVYIDIRKKSDQHKDNLLKYFNREELHLLLVNFLYMIWIFLGIFSSQWIFFLSIFLLNIGSYKFKEFEWATKLDAFLSFAIIIFMLINKFHYRFLTI